MADGVDHTHGDAGDKPAQNLDFTSGGIPDPETFDWFWSQVPAAINDHQSLLEAIDSNEDGIVDEAESAQSAQAVKGNDIDSDGDGKVDAADDADSLQGNAPDDLRVDIEDGGTLLLSAVKSISFEGDLNPSDDGDGTVSVSASTTEDTHIDVDDPQTSVSGTDIDTLEIGPNIDLVDEGSGRFRIEADDDATTYKGNDIDSDGDGKVDSAETADEVKAADGSTHVAGSSPEYADISTGESNTARGDKFVVEQSDGYHEYLVE